MVRGLFIEGTASGVGKTTITSAIAAALVRRSIHVAVMKPVQTNCPLEAQDVQIEVGGLEGRFGQEELDSLSRLSQLAGPPPSALLGKTPPCSLQASDAQRLLQFAGRDDPLDVVCPYRFATPLEPAVVSRLRETPIEIEHIVGCFNQLAGNAELVLVEGCCGLMAPLDDQHVMLDLIAKLELAVLLIGPSETGVINNCLLAIQALRQRELPIAGVVLNRMIDEIRPEEAANPYQIEKHCGALVRGVMPYIKHPDDRSDPETMARHVTRSIDLDALRLAEK
jgi:dethiobiotin synthetase